MKEREMRVTRNKWWNQLTGPIVGFDDGEGEGAGEGAGDGSQEGAGEGQGEGGAGDEGAGAGEDTAGLKSALAKERADRKALEKELNARKKADQKKADAELSDIDRLTKENEAERNKGAKLAAGFKRNALNQAVLAEAGKLKFRDPSDALRPEVLEAIGVEQDDDDPSQVTVDSASVTSALKALAKSKPHYLNTDNGQQQQQQKQTAPKSGSQFGGGSGTTTNLTADEQALAAKYPALAHRIR